MRPRTKDQAQRPALLPRKAEIILRCRPRIGVVPAGQVDAPDVGVTVEIAFRIDPRLLPEIIEDAVRPLLEQIILVFGSRTNGRVAFAPWHPREPRLDVLGL